MYYLFANSYLRPVLSSAVIPGNVALQKCPPGNIPNKHLYNTKANCLPTLVLNLKFSKELNNSCVFNIYFFFQSPKVAGLITILNALIMLALMCTVFFIAYKVPY